MQAEAEWVTRAAAAPANTAASAGTNAASAGRCVCVYLEGEGGAGHRVDTKD